MRKYSFWLFYLGCYLVFLCCQSDAHPQTSKSVDQSKINEVYDHFSDAYRTLDISLVDHIYLDSAIYLNPGSTIQFGKSSFIDSFSDMFERTRRDSTTLDIQFRILDRQVVNDLAVDVGYFRLVRTRDTTLSTNVGKFITVLKEQPDKSWKFIADGYSQAPVDAW